MSKLADHFPAINVLFLLASPSHTLALTHFIGYDKVSSSLRLFNLTYITCYMPSLWNFFKRQPSIHIYLYKTKKGLVVFIEDRVKGSKASYMFHGIV